MNGNDQRFHIKVRCSSIEQPLKKADFPGSYAAYVHLFALRQPVFMIARRTKSQTKNMGLSLAQIAPGYLGQGVREWRQVLP